MDGQTSQQQPQSQAYEPTCKAPHPNDVLCGSGDPTNQHVGNAHWRSLIAANKRMYLELPKDQKKLVPASIVKAIRGQNPPGRFLKFDHHTGTWADVGDSKATAKTSEALANAANTSSTTPAAGFASGAKTDNESDCHSSANGGGDSTGASSTQTPLADNKMGPKTLAQVATKPKVDAGATAGAVTEQQLLWQLIQQEAVKQNPHQQHFSEQQAQSQATMHPAPPRQPQQPQQSIQQQQGPVQMQPPLQEQLQSPEQIQNQISQVALLLKQLEVQVQSQGVQIIPEQQAQYTFLTQQQQILAQMFSLAQQQEQLASQQQQVMQISAELEGRAAVAAVAASSNAEMSRMQNEKPPGSKAQKRLSHEDLARWNRVKVMLAKTTMGTTRTTESAHASHYAGSSHAKIPYNTMNPAPAPALPPPAGGQHENDAASTSRHQPQATSLNRDVSMISAFSGLSGIISIGDAGDFGLERGDTRGNGTADMTDMTRDLSAQMSEMSFSRGPSLSALSAIPRGMFGGAQNDTGTGQTRGSLTGLDDDDDDDDDHEDQFKSLREGGYRYMYM